MILYEKYNKTLQLTSRYAVSLRYNQYCPSAEFRRYRL